MTWALRKICVTYSRHSLGREGKNKSEKEWGRRVGSLHVQTELQTKWNSLAPNSHKETWKTPHLRCTRDLSLLRVWRYACVWVRDSVCVRACVCVYVPYERVRVCVCLSLSPSLLMSTFLFCSCCFLSCAVRVCVTLFARFCSQIRLCNEGMSCLRL